VSAESGPWGVDEATERATLPRLPHLDELEAILRAGLLSEVRMFEAVCERRHRFVQVLRIGGRPLVFGEDTSRIQHKHHTHVDGRWGGVWLDAPDIVVPDGNGGVAHVVTRYTFTCRDESVLIPMQWLREQVAAGRRVRVIDEATRREMVVPLKGQTGYRKGRHPRGR
jgi:hypothetical protein